MVGCGCVGRCVVCSCGISSLVLARLHTTVKKNNVKKKKKKKKHIPLPVSGLRYWSCQLERAKRAGALSARPCPRHRSATTPMGRLPPPGLLPPQPHIRRARMHVGRTTAPLGGMARTTYRTPATIALIHHHQTNVIQPASSLQKSASPCATPPARRPPLSIATSARRARSIDPCPPRGSPSSQ